MNYPHLIKSLAASTDDSWCLIEYPGPTVQVCSLGLRQSLLAMAHNSRAHANEEKRNELLTNAFESVWRVGNAEQNIALPVPLGNFDHVRIIQVNEAHEPDAFLIHFLQLAVAPALAPEESADAIFDFLSPRQADVLNGVYAGETNKSIASRLGISQKTVEKHRAKVMERLDVGSVVELIRLITVLKLGSTTDAARASSTVPFSSVASNLGASPDGHV